MSNDKNVKRLTTHRLVEDLISILATHGIEQFIVILSFRDAYIADTAIIMDRTINGSRPQYTDAKRHLMTTTAEYVPLRDLFEALRDNAFGDPIYDVMTISVTGSETSIKYH